VIARRIIVLLLLLGALAEAWPAAQTLVLVVRRDSPVTDLDSVTVRKLFLGVPVLINGTPLRPIRNRSEPHLDEIFLQQIVAMSQPSYDRQILNGVNRQGWLAPSEAASVTRVAAELNANPNAVSFMWERDVAHNPNLRVLRVLWSD